MSDEPTARISRVGTRKHDLARQRPPRSAQAPAPAGRTGRRGRRRRPGSRIVGEVVVRGRTRRVTAPTPRRSLLRRRYAVVYEIDGPRILLGVLWFAAVVIALVVGPILLVPLYSVAAGWAGWQTARAWHAVGTAALSNLAAAGAASIVFAAAFGTALAGLAVLCLVGGAAVGASIGPEGRRGVSLVESAGATVQSALFAGLAGASVVLTVRLEIGAAVVLLVLVAAYEIGDYVVGSGASSSLEGPMAGAVAVAVASFVIAVLRIPPFDGADALVFGGFAVIGCPLGQLFGSALLPAAGAPAPALRRLDSLLLLGPVWCLLVGIYVERAVG